MSTGTVTAGNAKNTTGSSGKNTVKVRILEKEVQMSCAIEDEENLKRAARRVDQSMQDFRQRNFSASVEKIAIVTAINMANELMRSASSSGSNTELVKKIGDMQLLVEDALADAAPQNSTQNSSGNSSGNSIENPGDTNSSKQDSTTNKKHTRNTTKKTNDEPGSETTRASLL